MGIVIVSSTLCADDRGDASVDRAGFDASRSSDLYYFGFERIPAAERKPMLAVLQFVLASTSQNPRIEDCTAVRITPTLYRIDTKALGWHPDQVHHVFTQTPYGFYATESPTRWLVNNPLWFIVNVTDPTETAGLQAYYRLLYGKAKIDRNTFLKIWEANQEAKHQIAFIEGASGVGRAKTRWLLQYPNAVRTDVWRTIDFFKILSKNDPLLNLNYTLGQDLKTPVHDGEELIAGMPKYSIKTRERCRAQAYLLSNKDGGQVEEGPGRLVVDHTELRQDGIIRNFCSCVSCHDKGLKFPNQDAFQHLLDSGAYVYEEKKNAVKVEDQVGYRGAEIYYPEHLQPIAQEIETANQEYGRFIRITTGLDTDQFRDAFRMMFRIYDSPVDLARAAIEIGGYDDAFLRDAISWYQTQGFKLDPRMAELAEGNAIARSRFEEIYTVLSDMCTKYQNHLRIQNGGKEK